MRYAKGLCVDEKLKCKLIHYNVGDKVLYKWPRINKSSPLFNPTPYTIVSVKGNQIIASIDGHQVTRNSSFFQKLEYPENGQVWLEPIELAVAAAPTMSLALPVMSAALVVTTPPPVQGAESVDHEDISEIETTVHLNASVVISPPVQVAESDVNDEESDVNDEESDVNDEESDVNDEEIDSSGEIFEDVEENYEPNKRGSRPAASLARAQIAQQSTPRLYNKTGKK